MATKKGKKIDFKYNLKLYWSLVRNYKFLVFLLLIILLVYSATGVVEKYIFKILIDEGTGYVNNTINLSAFKQTLLLLFLTFLIITVIRVLARYTKAELIRIFETKLMTDLKRKFFNHLIHLSYDFHTTHRTGSLISRLVRGGSAIERMTDVFLMNTIPLIFNLIVAGVALASFDVISLIVLIVTIIVFVVYSVIIQNIQKKANVEANDAEDHEKANISDVFTNIDSIKYFGKEHEIKKIFERISEKTRKTLLKFWGYYSYIEPGQDLITSIGLFFMVYFPLKGFLEGTITLGTLVFIYSIYTSIVAHVNNFVHGIRNYYRAMADFESLFQYNKIQNEVKDAPNAKELKIKQGIIEYRNVDFAYKNRTIFKNFNLKIPQNKKIALVGPSGSGKTTLIKILYRMYDVNRGSILIDNEDIRDYKQETLRSELSIVPQECVLFDDTIYNNISFSKPGATRTEVLKAIKFAQLDKIINKFPNKENTIVGERGVRLSGGEKQRVSIARALLADKKVLVLDEATSSLDSETEHEIQKDLQELMEGRTTIIIAHRLSTIMKADIIVVLENGKIVQQGTHKELIGKTGLYKRLWHLQKGGYIE